MLEMSWRSVSPTARLSMLKPLLAKKTGYLGENTVFIFYKYRKNTFHLAFSLFCVVVAVDFADHDAGLVAGEETVELCVESFVAVAVEIVHIVGSGDFSIFRIIVELNTEIVFLVSLFPDAHGRDRDSGFS